GLKFLTRIKKKIPLLKKANLTKPAGIKLIETAISSSRERDAASGFKLQICTIDKTGFKQIQ
ncbi:unnamed protein product, partial [marine sediment metagenome]